MWPRGRGLPFRASERWHFSAEYHALDLSVRYWHNDADFYDLFGPTERSRKGDAVLGDVDRLLIQQELNPETGSVNGVDVQARQVLRLLPRDSTVARAEVVEDPVHTPSRWMVRVRWLPEDRLLRRYCFITQCAGAKINNVSSFYGNLVWVTHGRPWQTTFKAPGSPLAGLDTSQFVGTDVNEVETIQKKGKAA